MGKGVFNYYPKVDNSNKPKKEWRSRSVIAAIYNEEDRSLSFGVSICSTKDIFSKREGRTKAQDRARYHEPILRVWVDENQDVTKVLSKLFVEQCKLLEKVIDSQMIGENKLKNKTKKSMQIA